MGDFSGNLIVWPLKKKGSVKPLSKEKYKQSVRSILWINNEEMLMGFLDGTIIFYNFKSKKSKQFYRFEGLTRYGEKEGVTRLSFNNNKSLIAVCTTHSRFIVLDSLSSNIVLEIKHAHPVPRDKLHCKKKKNSSFFFFFFFFSPFQFLFLNFNLF